MQIQTQEMVPIPLSPYLCTTIIEANLNLRLEMKASNGKISNWLSRMGLISLSIAMAGAGCTNSASYEDSVPSGIEKPAIQVSNENEQKESDGTNAEFERFLGLFSTRRPMGTWDADALMPLVMDDEIFKSDQTALQKTLTTEYDRIPKHLAHFVPVSHIVDMDPEYSVPIKNPVGAYEFYAFATEKREDYHLVSIFAYKHTMEASVYHLHPFVLATYSNDGKFIDDFVWWIIVADDIQVWNEVEIREDTFLVGSKEAVQASRLSQVYEKTVLAKDGTFQTFFSDYPEGSLRARIND